MSSSRKVAYCSGLPYSRRSNFPLLNRCGFIPRRFFCAKFAKAAQVVPWFAGAIKRKQRKVMEKNTSPPKGSKQEPTDAERADALQCFLAQYRLKAWPIYSRPTEKFEKLVEFIDRNPKNSKRRKKQRQAPTPENHARLLLQMYSKKQARRIAKQYVANCRYNSKAHLLWSKVFWILNDLGPLPEGLE